MKGHFKGIEFLSQTQILSLLLCNPMSKTLDISNYEFCWIKFSKFENQRFTPSEMEFKEFEPRSKSAKIRFKFNAGLNLETFDTILSGTNHI